MVQPNDLIVLYDGECNLCDKSVQFIIKNDTAGMFKFCSQQLATKFVPELNLEKSVSTAASQSGSIVLLDHGVSYNRSTAVLRIASRLRFPWNLCRIFLIVPEALRNVFYGLLSRNRYRLFGKRETCSVPSPELRSRFLDMQ